MRLYQHLLSGALVVILLSSCDVFEAGREEGPILPVAAARHQAKHAWLAFVGASRQADRVRNRFGRVISSGRTSAYGRVEAEADQALDKMTKALAQAMDAEENFHRALEHQFGKGKAFQVAWDEWERWKKDHPVDQEPQPQEPQPVNELIGIRLGMKPVEVKLNLGAPATQKSLEPVGTYQSWVWTYQDSFIVFSGFSNTGTTVSRVCTYDFDDTRALLARIHTPEETLIKKLGPWKYESIASSGLSKLVSYPQFNVAYELTRGSVSQVCMFDGGDGSGRITYREEYAGEHSMGKEFGR